METRENLRKSIQNLIRKLGIHIASLQELQRSIGEQIPQSFFRIFSSKKGRSLKEISTFEKELHLTRIDLLEDIVTLNEIDSQPENLSRNKRIEERLSKHIKYTNQVLADSLNLIKKFEGNIVSSIPSYEDTTAVLDKGTIGKAQEVHIKFLDDPPGKVKRNEEVAITFYEPVEASGRQEKEDETPVQDVETAQSTGNVNEEPVELLVGQGRHQEVKGDMSGYRGAISSFKKAIALVPPCNERYTQILAEIENAYDQMLKLYGDREDAVRVVFEKGEFLFEHGCFDKAIAIFREISKIPEWRESAKEMLKKCGGGIE